MLDKNRSQDYRTRIYQNYASNFQDAEEVFDSDAANQWGKAYTHYFKDWFPQSKDSRIVDLACGGGKLLQLFKMRGFNEVEGVDLSGEQVSLARQVGFPVTEIDAIEYLESNPSGFDLITALDLVEHFKKEEVLPFLDVCYSALKPGGRLILQTPNAESPWGTSHRYNDFTHEVGFNPNSLSRLLQLVGFSKSESRELGPIPIGYSVGSSLRWVIWRIIHSLLKIWTIAETGSAGSQVYTRVFAISVKKKK